MCPGSPAGPPDELAKRLKAEAAALGFDLCGIARAEALDPAPLRDWIARGDAADMDYMKGRLDERLDPGRVVPGARSVVALAVSYFRPQDEGDPALRRVARYARGRDYHLFLRRKVRQLRRRLLALAPGARVHPSVDTSPVMEKVWAQKAGLGWVGKNGLLIAPPFGSWVLLATLITDLALAPDAPHPERCGSCNACLPACPTLALRGRGEVDSRRCLSYWNIETDAPIPDELKEAASRWTFGCDACQEACPWNEGAAASRTEAFAPRPLVRLRCSELAALGRDAWGKLAQGSPLRRPGYDGLRRSATLGLAHEGEAALESLERDPAPAVRDAAAWVRSRA